MTATVRILDYANGAGGRIFDLPRGYQDAIAAVVRRLHPGTVNLQVLKVMASGGYLASDHPLVRGLTSDELVGFHGRFARRAATDGAG